MRELSLFSGAGGGLLATKHLLGWRTIGYVEIDEYCQAVLAQRIEDGYLDPAPIFGDIRRFISEGYAEAYQGMVDVVTAGFPCTPWSEVGSRQGKSHSQNLWPETAKTVCLIRPDIVLLENVSNIVNHEYFGHILGDLAEMGFDARWGMFSACAFGAPHSRERMFLLAYADKQRSQTRWAKRSRNDKTLYEWRTCAEHLSKIARTTGRKIWPAVTPEPSVSGVADGIPYRVDRSKAIGNGQVPKVVEIVWRLLRE